MSYRYKLGQNGLNVTIIMAVCVRTPRSNEWTDLDLEYLIQVGTYFTDKKYPPLICGTVINKEIDTVGMHKKYVSTRDLDVDIIRAFIHILGNAIVSIYLFVTVIVIYYNYRPVCNTFTYWNRKFIIIIRKTSTAEHRSRAQNAAINNTPSLASTSSVHLVSRPKPTHASSSGSNKKLGILTNFAQLWDFTPALILKKCLFSSFIVFFTNPQVCYHHPYIVDLNSSIRRMFHQNNNGHTKQLK